MAQPELPSTVEVGVVLPGRPDDVSEWLADGGAFESAGAEALWVDIDPGSALDPLPLTAALAVLTVRSQLVVTLADADLPIGRTLATIGRLCRGRLRLPGTVASDPATTDPAIPDPATTDSATTAGATTDRAVSGRVLGDQIADEVVVHRADLADPQVWLRVPTPDSRTAWQETVAAAVERGYSRVMVPASPRLLDILRNPEDPGDRHDLQLAQG